jgi:hypothetical protein
MKHNSIDRKTEIEKIAERLGIGKDRDVDCSGCQKVIKLKDASIITTNNETRYLCQTCLQDLLNGKLKKSTEQDDLLDQIKEVIRREIASQSQSHERLVPIKPYDIGGGYGTPIEKIYPKQDWTVKFDDVVENRNTAGSSNYQVTQYTLENKTKMTFMTPGKEEA